MFESSISTDEVEIEAHVDAVPVEPTDDPLFCPVADMSNERLPTLDRELQGLGDLNGYEDEANAGSVHLDLYQEAQEEEIAEIEDVEESGIHQSFVC